MFFFCRSQPAIIFVHKNIGFVPCQFTDLPWLFFMIKRLSDTSEDVRRDLPVVPEPPILFVLRGDGEYLRWLVPLNMVSIHFAALLRSGTPFDTTELVSDYAKEARDFLMRLKEDPLTTPTPSESLGLCVIHLGLGSCLTCSETCTHVSNHKEHPLCNERLAVDDQVTGLTYTILLEDEI